ncbi:MAG: hypothetical protein AAFO04_28895 [Cyanobacteria bacterium J06592_8]
MNQTQDFYKHTQIGTLTIVLLAIIALFIAGVITAVNSWNWGFILVLVILLIVGLLSATLTVEVRNDYLKCWFSFGVIRREFPLSDIVEAAAVKNHWYYGWGIRKIPQGLMFNVSGLDAVEITLKSGKKFRIGTDQPTQLEAAIRQG